MTSTDRRTDPTVLATTECKSSSNFGEVNGRAKKNKCLLPQINPSHTGITPKTGDNPSLTMNDFLPLELLLSLKHQKQEASPSGGWTKFHPGGGAVRPPAGMWSHANRRDRLKHLVDAPPCICGSGRDISFLYDTVHSKEKTLETKKVGQSS